jgi:hypothetical protein
MKTGELSRRTLTPFVASRSCCDLRQLLTIYSVPGRIRERKHDYGCREDAVELVAQHCTWSFDSDMVFAQWEALPCLF